MATRIVVMDQATSEWLAWRRGGIGSSDIGVIMGVSPWATPLELYRIKMGEAQEAPSNPAIERGREWEPKARAAYELLTGVDAPPRVIEHAEVPWIRASLDGYCDATATVLEIKVPGKDDHATAVAGKLPEKYRPQVQWQLMLTGALRAHYYSYNPDTGGALVEVLPDTAYHNTLFDRAHRFWHEHVLARVPPPMTDDDTLSLDNDSSWCKRVGELMVMKQELDALTARFDEAKQWLVDVMPHGRVECLGVKFTRYAVAGRVDYSAIPGLDGVDLDRYRKPATTAVKITWPKV